MPQSLWAIFVLSPRERQKRDRRRDSRRDEREGQGRKRNRNDSEETEEIKTSPSTLTCYKDARPCPTVRQYQMCRVSCGSFCVVSQERENKDSRDSMMVKKQKK